MIARSPPLDDVGPDARAIEVLGQFPPRRVVGQAMSERVGRRGWLPPRFARGASLFKRLGLPNPWDPAARKVGTGLGEVGIPRQPAPHLLPPSPKAAPGKGPTGPNLPQAPQRREIPEGARAAPRIGEVRKVGADETRPRPPDRPNATPTPPTRPTPTQGPFGPYATKHPVAKLPMRPGVIVPGSVPLAPPPASQAAPNAAAQPAPAPPEAPAPAKPPPPLENRTPPRVSAGLDDLFGMGAENTRIRLPKAEPAVEGAPPRRGRPVVTSPEELARLGLDRRPPPPKAPPTKKETDG